MLLSRVLCKVSRFFSKVLKVATSEIIFKKEEKSPSKLANNNNNSFLPNARQVLRQFQPVFGSRAELLARTHLNASVALETRERKEKRREAKERNENAKNLNRKNLERKENIVGE